MKIVIAPDSYKESLSAQEVAETIFQGFKALFPDADYRCIPVADGGEGTVNALVAATGGTIQYCTVTGPLGKPLSAFFGITGDNQTAIIEMAAASGLEHVHSSKRNPLMTTSYGTGELILAALGEGVRHIILGIGGSATVDGGIGMIQALGGRFLDEKGNDLAYGGSSLAQLTHLDMSQLDPRLQACRIEVACDVDNPLTGPQGAARIFGPQKGATEDMVAILDNNLAHYADIIQQQLGKAVADMPGAGAAGGMGAAAIAFMGATLRPGIDIVLEAAQLARHVHDADLVITGEGRIDSQTIHGKTPIGVAKLAKQFDIPVIAIGGCYANDAGVVHQHGIDAVFGCVRQACTLEQALQEAKNNLYLSAYNVAAAIKLGAKLNRSMH